MKFTIEQFRNMYPDENACLDKIFSLKYGNLKQCPKCGKDIFHKYESICEGGKSKFVKIVNVRDDNHPEFSNRVVWDVEYTCPKCGTKWSEDDANM